MHTITPESSNDVYLAVLIRGLWTRIHLQGFRKMPYFTHINGFYFCIWQLFSRRKLQWGLNIVNLSVLLKTIDTNISLKLMLAILTCFGLYQTQQLCGRSFSRARCWELYILVMLRESDIIGNFKPCNHIREKYNKG